MCNLGSVILYKDYKIQFLASRDSFKTKKNNIKCHEE